MKIDVIGGANRESAIHFRLFFSFRLLQKLTDPPAAIQAYAVRVCRKAGRDKNLKTLPEDVETVLIDFALDMLGYGKPEIRSPASVQLEDSRYFTSLGRTYEERSAALNTLVDEREDWKRHMSKALQLALRDIRNYTCSETNGIPQWVKNTRQKKVDLQMDSSNHTFQ
ncbi:hypothetical protein Q1695_011235 [Nippostrongylus brasiliensis]|nr:hypothetical protein Q1695_011235 [Nippostrongylus brasiliensis]